MAHLNSNLIQLSISVRKSMTAFQNRSTLFIDPTIAKNIIPKMNSIMSMNKCTA